jgi:ribonuclease G
MFRELIINVAEHETRVALLEDGTIVELFINRGDETDISGNIYKGRVQRVLPGMQAAFIDIGLDQAAFLYVDDLIHDQFCDIARLFIDRSEEDNPVDADIPEDVDSEAGKRPFKRQCHIEDIITEGQEILVHVAKSPIGTKGARVTSHVSLPGRFLVLMPSSNHIGISRKIEEEAERRRLKQLVDSLREDESGYIVRTAAEGVGPEKIKNEIELLNHLWKSIQERYRTASAPALLHKELAVSLRAVRDLTIHDADKIMIDSRAGYESILSFLDTFMPNVQDSVELYEGKEPIFDAYNLEGDISRALKRKVWLKSGGYIVIEHTEALVAIDVNTGRYVGKYNLEETILKTNLEAVREIAYQVRLRDLGGIIIIDFIDMEKKANQEKIFNALKEALKRDRSKTHVLPISDIGLVQMTRKRIKQPLTRILCEPCFYCDGEGYIISKQSVCYNIYRGIQRECQDSMGVILTVQVNPEIADLLHGEENHLILSLERKIGKQIVIYPNPDFHIEQFDIIESVSER